MNITAYSINSFTMNGRGGNPAGVVLDADRLTEQQMLGIAKHLNFSETAFVSQSINATYRVRFFTPVEEVDLCGHATIAAWSLLFDQGLAAGLYTQETLAGVLKVEIVPAGVVYMEQAAPKFYETVPSQEVANILGISPSDLDPRLEPQVVSTGLRDLQVAVRDAETLNDMRPDFFAMTQLSKRLDLVGMHVFTLATNNNVVAEARNFAPRFGIEEESATGTSNGALLCYLHKYGLLSDENEYIIEQGRKMGLLSRIYGQFREDQIWIGGKAALVSKNQLEVEE